MSDARQNRDSRVMNGIRDALVVKGPQVLQRTPSPDEDEHFGPAFPIFGGDGIHDLRRRFVPLHGDGWIRIALPVPRSPDSRRKSLMAAPRGAVITVIRRGCSGSGRLRSRLK